MSTLDFESKKKFLNENFEIMFFFLSESSVPVLVFSLFFCSTLLAHCSKYYCQSKENISFQGFRQEKSSLSGIFLFAGIVQLYRYQILDPYSTNEFCRLTQRNPASDLSSCPAYQSGHPPPVASSTPRPPMRHQSPVYFNTTTRPPVCTTFVGSYNAIP